MYDYSYTTTAMSGGSSFGSGIIGLAFTAFTLFCMWKVYEKAGKPGWSALIPIYNIIVLFQIVEMPTWKILLLFVPIVNIVILFKVYFKLAEKFNKPKVFGLGLIFLGPIFFAILTFDKSAVYGDANSGMQQNVAPATPVAPTQPIMPEAPVAPEPMINPEPVVQEQPIMPEQPVVAPEPVAPVAPEVPVAPEPAPATTDIFGVPTDTNNNVQ